MFHTWRGNETCKGNILGFQLISAHKFVRESFNRCFKNHAKFPVTGNNWTGGVCCRTLVLAGIHYYTQKLTGDLP